MEMSNGIGENLWKECGNYRNQIIVGFNRLFATKVDETKKSFVGDAKSNLELSNQETEAIEISAAIEIRAKQDFMRYQRSKGVKHQQGEHILLRKWDFHRKQNIQTAHQLFLVPQVATVILMDITNILYHV